MKRALLAIALLCAFSASAVAQTKAPPSADDIAKMRKAAETKGPETVKAWTAASKATCNLVGSAIRGSTADKSELLEISCKDTWGYVLLKHPTGVIDSYNCLQLSKSDGTRCILPENADVNAPLKAAVLAAKYPCDKLVDTAVRGKSAAAKLDRYEAACSGDRVFLVDIYWPSENKATKVVPCLLASGSGVDCKLQTKADLLRLYAPVAAKADPSCTTTDLKWIAASKNDEDYIEFKCDGKAGFITKTSPAGVLLSTITCTESENLIPGGCTLSDMTAIRAATLKGYVDRLGSAAGPCTATKATEIANETGRPYRAIVQFDCPEHPDGVVAFLPDPKVRVDPKVPAKVSVVSCLTIQVHSGITCRDIDGALLVTRFTELMHAYKKPCNVKQYRPIGPYDTTVVFEAACEDGRGYITEIANRGDKITSALPCHIAATHADAEKCAIPGNGKNTAPLK